MKAIVLAGETRSKISTITRVIPKQLLPIYNKPMIMYPLEVLLKSNIKDILIITAAEHQYMFKNLLGDGHEYGANFSYAIQSEPNGIADAIKIGKHFIGKDTVCLITGDTILLFDEFKSLIAKAERAAKVSGSATIFVSDEICDYQYGKVIMTTGGKKYKIVGNDSNYNYLSITGIYIFPPSVIEAAERVTTSERGLLEINDVNKIYFEQNRLQILTLPKGCIWLDTNTADTILDAGIYIRKQNSL